MWRYRALFSQMRKMLALKSRLDLLTRRPILSLHCNFHSPFWLLETSPSHSPQDITASSMVLVWIISFRSNNSIICLRCLKPPTSTSPFRSEQLCTDSSPSCAYGCRWIFFHLPLSTLSAQSLPPGAALSRNPSSWDPLSLFCGITHIYDLCKIRKI